MSPLPKSHRVALRRPSTPAFTLIEIMIVVAILGIVLGMGLPSIIQGLEKEPIRQASSDMIEALRWARAQAILDGVPAVLVIRAEDGVFWVPHDPPPSEVGPSSSPRSPAPGEPPASARPLFRRQLDSDTAITLLELNQFDQMDEPQTEVRFFPNGTSDDFTVVLEHGSRVRRIWLDPVTGMPDTQVLR